MVKWGSMGFSCILTQKTNGWNLKITPKWKGISSSIHLHFRVPCWFSGVSLPQRPPNLRMKKHLKMGADVVIFMEWPSGFCRPKINGSLFLFLFSPRNKWSYICETLLIWVFGPTLCCRIGVGVTLLVFESDLNHCFLGKTLKDKDSFIDFLLTPKTRIDHIHWCKWMHIL